MKTWIPRAARHAALLMVLATAAAAQERTPTEAEARARLDAEVEKVVHGFYAAMTAAKSEALLALVSRDFKLVSPSGSIGRQEFRAQVERMRGGASHTLTGFKTTVKDTVAETSFMRVTQDGSGRRYPYQETAQFRRVDGKWLITQLQSKR